MDEILNDASEIGRRFNSHGEWLVVRENGVAFPVSSGEMEIESRHGQTRFGFVGDRGLTFFRLRSCRFEGEELAMDVSVQFGGAAETIRLVPRTSAGALARDLELARLKRAGDIAGTIARHYPQLKLSRVGLNKNNGRFAEILFEAVNHERFAVLSDVTEVLTAENLLASGLLWIDRLRSRSKKPVAQLWLAAPKKQARLLQKLVALLRPAARSDIRILMLDVAKKDSCVELKDLKLTDLWRERPPKFVPPDSPEMSETARRILSVSPESIDVLNSKQGETLRFLGLPFARVRRVSDRERSWFGIDRERRTLNDDTRAELTNLLDLLASYRRADSEGRRHRFYTMSPEFWLESILRRNIKLLDDNLILSPLYNQFRTSFDKIDLLALRRDGRLVIIELKTSPDREMVLQAADYWRKIEMHRRRGNLARAKVFGELQILDKPALVYAVAPALSFHRDFEYFARKLAPEIELWRFELHERWRDKVKVIARKNYDGRA